MASDSTGTSRAGRLPAADREQRRREILRAATAEIAERGYERTTTAGIARRAGASKETLYSWFGDKAGLVRAVIEANADSLVPVLPDRPEAGTTLSQARHALISCAEGLLLLLTSRDSVALNRAAMTSPELARTLAEAGRGRTGAAIEDYLSGLHRLGLVQAPDPREAFELYFGLVVRDRQVRALLGTPPPSDRQLRAEARVAVERFLALVGAGGGL